MYKFLYYIITIIFQMGDDYLFNYSNSKICRNIDNKCFSITKMSDTSAFDLQNYDLYFRNKFKYEKYDGQYTPKANDELYVYSNKSIPNPIDAYPKEVGGTPKKIKICGLFFVQENRGFCLSSILKSVNFSSVVFSIDNRFIY